MKSGEELLKTKQSGKQGEQAFSLEKAKSFFFFFFFQRRHFVNHHLGDMCANFVWQGPCVNIWAH